MGKFLSNINQDLQNLQLSVHSKVTLSMELYSVLLSVDSFSLIDEKLDHIRTQVFLHSKFESVRVSENQWKFTEFHSMSATFGALTNDASFA